MPINYWAAYSSPIVEGSAATPFRRWASRDYSSLVARRLPIAGASCSQLPYNRETVDWAPVRSKQIHLCGIPTTQQMRMSATSQKPTSGSLKLFWIGVDASRLALCLAHSGDWIKGMQRSRVEQV